MDIVQVVYHIRGLSPLIMNNPAAMLKARSTKASTKAKRIPSPEDEAEAGCYRGADGFLCGGTIGFKRGLLYAATGKKIGKYTALKLMAAAVFERDETAPLVDPDTGKPIKDYEVYITSVVIQRARVPKARPRIHQWAIDVIFEVDLDYVTPQQVGELLTEAGLMAGYGDFRPQKSGRFGRYAVTGFEVIDTAVKMAAE